MAAPPKNDRVDALIVCEGDTDRHFLEALLIARGLPKFQVRSAGSKDNLHGKLATYKLQEPEKFRKLKSVCVCIDKDGDEDAAFANAIKQLGKSFPSRQLPTAPLVTVGSQPQLSVILIPPTGAVGHIESYLQSVAKTVRGPLPGLIEDFLAQVQADKWGDDRRYKAAWLRIFMAISCPDPSMTLGELFRDDKVRHLIDMHHRDFNRLETFLKQLTV